METKEMLGRNVGSGNEGDMEERMEGMNKIGRKEGRVEMKEIL